MDTWRVHHNGLPDIRQEDYTVDELAALLDISREVILHEIHAGHLHAERLGGRCICVRRVDVLEWLDQRARVG